MLITISQRAANDPFLTQRCPVWVHPTVIYRGIELGINELQTESKMEIVFPTAGQPAKLVRK